MPDVRPRDQRGSETETQTRPGSLAPTPNNGQTPPLRDQLRVAYLGKSVFLTLQPRGGRELSVVLDPLDDGLDFLLHFMELLWTHSPPAAQALLDHLNESKPQP